MIELEKTAQNDNPNGTSAVSYLREVSARGGPRPAEDERVSGAFRELHGLRERGELSESTIELLRTEIPFDPETMQGFVYRKPNGYAGCFEIIDRIYCRHHADRSDWFNWDRFMQSQGASVAVRNRKDYFIQTVLDRYGDTTEKRKGGYPMTVLNIASGPCRDVKELLDAARRLDVVVTCVEQDERAIQYARDLCRNHENRIEFIQANALRWSTDRKFDLVWSAGLFDYLSDSLFQRLLNRLFNRVRPGGELVVGNFCTSNPSRAYMEFSEWNLHHRSEEQLLAFGRELEGANDLRVDREPAGVNLFLHGRKKTASSNNGKNVN